MSLYALKIFLSRKDVKIFIFCIVTGGILQVVCKEYLKNHPELIEDAPVTNSRPRFLSPRGGALIEASAISIKVMIFLANNGFITSVLVGTGLFISQNHSTAVNTYLRDSFPQNLPHLEKKKFILVDGEKIYLDQCDQNCEYLFKILKDETIPFEEKEKVADSILTKYLNLETMPARLAFVLCIVLILYILSIQNPAGFYILLKNLIKAIKEGKIPKVIARIIIRKLRKKGVAIDPELLEVVVSS
jgi:hypothetical protein